MSNQHRLFFRCSNFLQASVASILLLGAASAVAVDAQAVDAQAVDARAIDAQKEPWLDKTKSTHERVQALRGAMTQDEKLTLVFGYASGDQLVQIADGWAVGANKKDIMSAIVPGSAGYIAGIPRLGIPAQFQTDASMGVRNPTLERTALPSSLATAASWNPRLAEQGGSMIGLEARQSGFNIMLAGGVNLVREPRNGRNFEYAGEDPLLAARMTAGLIKGIQSNSIVSTIKHFAVNSQETGRFVVNAQIADAAAHQSDYLAFELAMEESSPGSVMCSYNKINGVYACENRELLTNLLKRDWRYPGYVMSDWGAVHSTQLAANSGLDQQSGFPFDKKPFFGVLLKDALRDGSVPSAQLDDMVGRILWALIDKGVIDNPVSKAPIDFATHARIAQAAAEESLVLLKNERELLPINAAVKSILVVGGYADKGLLSGGGSSQVTTPGGNAVPGIAPLTWPGPVFYIRSSPVAALQALLPNTHITYVDGKDRAAAKALAKQSDLVIVFVTQWAGEAFDVSLSLGDEQDQLVADMADANGKTAVVIESGGAVYMPWLKQVRAVVQAWYPGSGGAAALARVLTGQVNPSGRLPISFPASDAQLVRKQVDGLGLKDDVPFDVAYSEGAAVGYKWHDLNQQKPLFPFGFGLSYSHFTYASLSASDSSGTLVASVSVTNKGKRAGMDVVQLYASPEAAIWESPKRLIGWAKVALKAGETKTIDVKVEPRLLATFEAEKKRWKITGGTYRVLAGGSSASLPLEQTLELAETTFAAQH